MQEHVEPTNGSGKKKRKGAATQSRIPGTERPDQIEAIDEAARRWRDALSAKAEADADIEEARSEIHALMREHDLEKYIAEDGEWKRVLTYKTEGKVKMRKPKRDEADE